MATQVKFYSVGTLPATASTTGKGGIYFVGSDKTAELYKGAVRFAGNRVTEVASLADAPSTAIQGDIIVCAKGGAFAYTGTEWKGIGPDLGDLQSNWQSDIKTWTAGLVAGGTGSIITGITQDEDGKVTATAISFPEITSPADGVVSLAGTSVKIEGWDELVSDKDDLEARVSAIETIVDADASTVTAETGIFKNLTVSDTATFNATTVEATTLHVDTEAGATFGEDNLTVSAIADREAAAKIAAIAEVTKEATGANVVTVSVTTKAGSVDKVEVGVQKATSIGPKDAKGTEGDADYVAAASDDKLATEKAVRDALNSFDNAMHFAGVVDELPATGEEGDIVVIKNEDGKDAPKGEKLVAGQEYIWDGTKWELIGDQNTYAANAYSKDGSAVMAGVTTVPTALDALANRVDGILGGYNEDTNSGIKVGVTVDANASVTGVEVAVTKASLNAALGLTDFADKSLVTAIAETSAASDENVPTEKAVRVAIDAVAADATALSEYVGYSTALDTGDENLADAINTLYSTIQTMDATPSGADNGVKVTVTQDAGALTDVTVVVSGTTSMAFGADGDATVATTSAVRSYFENNLVWLGSDSQPLND